MQKKYSRFVGHLKVKFWKEFSGLRVCVALGASNEKNIEKSNRTQIDSIISKVNCCSV